MRPRHYTISQTQYRTWCLQLEDPEPLWPQKSSVSPESVTSWWTLSSASVSIYHRALLKWECAVSQAHSCVPHLRCPAYERGEHLLLSDPTKYETFRSKKETTGPVVRDRNDDAKCSITSKMMTGQIPRQCTNLKFLPHDTARDNTESVTIKYRFKEIRTL